MNEEAERAEFEKAFARLYPNTQTGTLFHNQCWEFWKARAVYALEKWTKTHSAFVEACLGDEVPELTRLSALRALIMEVKRLGLANDEDPVATSETLTEVEQLFEMLRVALQADLRESTSPPQESRDES